MVIFHRFLYVYQAGYAPHLSIADWGSITGTTATAWRSAAGGLAQRSAATRPGPAGKRWWWKATEHAGETRWVKAMKIYGKSRWFGPWRCGEHDGWSCADWSWNISDLHHPKREFNQLSPTKYGVKPTKARALPNQSKVVQYRHLRYKLFSCYTWGDIRIASSKYEHIFAGAHLLYFVWHWTSIMETWYLDCCLLAAIL